MADKREVFEDTAIPLLDQVYTTARYLAGTPEEADDLVQETFLRAYRFWEGFQPGTNCRAWLLTILHNVFRNRYRERRREPRGVELDGPGTGRGSGFEIPDQSGNPEDLVLANVLDGEVEAALRQLPPDFLDVVVLIDVQELSYEEAAEVIGCPVGTVRSRLSRARSQLHRRLGEYARARGLVTNKHD